MNKVKVPNPVLNIMSSELGDKPPFMLLSIVLPKVLATSLKIESTKGEMPNLFVSF
jgi:hypothetical protein